MAKPAPRWDDQIIVLYSVLAGLSFQQMLAFVAFGDDWSSRLLLTFLLFFIVIDNWIYLAIYLNQIDIDNTLEAVLYVPALISYSCLPFLLGISSNGLQRALGIEGSTQWMIFNLILIVLFDAFSKAVITRKIYSKSAEWFDDERLELFGTFFLYAATGFFVYFPSLSFLLAETKNIGSFLERFSIDSAIVPLIIWLLIRSMDHFIIPTIASTISQSIIHLAKRKYDVKRTDDEKKTDGVKKKD